MNRDKIDSFLKTKTGKITIILIIIILLIGLSFMLLKINQIIHQDEFTPEMTNVNDPSGLEVYDSNYEDESSTTELQKPLIIGLGILEENDLSTTNKNSVTDSLRSFFQENYPDVKRVSYLKDSFKSPDPNDSFLHEFTVVTDQGEKFKVIINNYGTYSFIDTEIEKL